MIKAELIEDVVTAFIVLKGCESVGGAGSQSQ